MEERANVVILDQRPHVFTHRQGSRLPALLQRALGQTWETAAHLAGLLGHEMQDGSGGPAGPVHTLAHHLPTLVVDVDLATVSSGMDTWSFSDYLSLDLADHPWPILGHDDDAYDHIERRLERQFRLHRPPRPRRARSLHCA